MQKSTLLPPDKQPELDGNARRASNFTQAAGCHRKAGAGEDVFTFEKLGSAIFLLRLWQCGKQGTGRSSRYRSTVSDVFPAIGSIPCYCKIRLNPNSPSVHQSAAERSRQTEKWAKPLQQCPRRESILLLQFWWRVDAGELLKKTVL